MTAQWWLAHGSDFPYDATDEWNDSVDIPPTPATDWAHRAARGVIVNLTDRRGIKQGLYDIDEETRVEIVETLAAIIRASLPSDQDTTRAG